MTGRELTLSGMVTVVCFVLQAVIIIPLFVLSYVKVTGGCVGFCVVCVVAVVAALFWLVLPVCVRHTKKILAVTASATVQMIMIFL